VLDELLSTSRNATICMEEVPGEGPAGQHAPVDFLATAYEGKIPVHARREDASFHARDAPGRFPVAVPV